MSFNCRAGASLEKYVELYTKIVDSYNGTRSAEETAKELGVCPHTVYNAKHNLADMIERKKKFDERDALILSTASQSKTSAEVAKELGLSVFLVKKTLCRLGYKHNKSLGSIRQKASKKLRGESLNSKMTWHKRKPKSEWVLCACKRSQKRSTDVHCAICDNEENRKLAGLPIAPISLSFDYFYNQQ